MNSKLFSKELASAETEADVIHILKRKGYWNDYSHWHPFGDNDNNFSVIGNQQSQPEAALVEKLINSVDAILMRDCLKTGIRPSGPDAPQSTSEALKQFYHIQEGRIFYLDAKTRDRMAQNIILAATGKKRGEMNIVIVDHGEGQTPESMPMTILSLSKDNKLKIPFVQGKFNMGGTGVLPFCGKNRFQLIISKRCPDITDRSDDSAARWSFTIVRREDAREGRKSSMYTYLTADASGKLFSFMADSLNIIPSPAGYEGEPDDFQYGTYIKLFNYELPHKNNILTDLNDRLSMLMPDLAYPIQIRECREAGGYLRKTTLSGLQTRLEDEDEQVLEAGFPSSVVFSEEKQDFTCQIYLFVNDKEKGKLIAQNYRGKNGMLFAINGQTHACVSELFFNKANLSYLADSLLVIVDCSQIDIMHREDMFMNSRDRLRSGTFSKTIMRRILEILKSHEGLRTIQNRRRDEAVRNKLHEDKPLQDVLQKILSKSPVLSQILLQGNRLKSPFNTMNKVGEDSVFKGKKHPTFFKIMGKIRDGSIRKVSPINHNFMVKFETDADNDYFSRSSEQGELQVTANGQSGHDLIHYLGLFNGIATLKLKMPDDASVGDQYTFETSIQDDCIVSTFPNRFTLSVDKPQENEGGAGETGNGAAPRTDENRKGNRTAAGAYSSPHIYEKYQEDWNKLDMDKYSAVVLRQTDEECDYFLNMDNEYLKTELKNIRDANKMALTKARYKYSMALIGMSIVSYFHGENTNSEGTEDIESQVEKITKMIAPVVIPMIDTMSALDISDIS